MKYLFLVNFHCREQKIDNNCFTVANAVITENILSIKVATDYNKAIGKESD